MPFLTTLSYYGLGFFELNSAKANAEAGNFDKAIKKTQSAKTFFETSQKASSFLIGESRYLGLSKDTDVIRAKAASAEELSSSLNYLLSGGNTLKQIFQGRSTDPANDFENAANSLKSGIAISETIKAEGNLPKDYESDLQAIKPLIDIFSNSSNVLPDALGFSEEKKYLVLLQNSSNLRPGGGYISSYGILTLRNGKITDFKAGDSYSLDQKLKEHIEPPYQIRRYVPSINLYLRDSNFDPDFVNNSIQASNIYSKETGKKVDGAIGMDLDLAKSLLVVTGPVNVPSFGIVSAESLEQLNLDDSNVKAAPSKNDFISLLASSITSNLENKKVDHVKLAKIISDSIRKKDLLFAFSDSSTQNIFTVNGWSGALWDARSTKSAQVNDFVGLSETNLGQNKVNDFVSRSLSKKTVIDSNGKVSSRLQIAYSNSSDKDSKNKSDYKNYVQLILPQGTIINSVLVDNQEVQVTKAVTDYFVYESKGFKSPKGFEMDQNDELGKTIYGFLFVIPAGKIKTISFDYNLPETISKSQDITKYSLKVYKQPGIDPFPFDFSFDLPNNFSVVSGENPLSQDIDSDHEFDYKLLQK